MRPRKQPTEGMLTAWPGLEAREDGKFTKGMAQSVKVAFDNIRDKLNGFLTLGGGEKGSWTGNVDGYTNDYTFPAVPDTEMTILHELGRTPRFVVVALQDRAGSIYTSSYQSWGSQRIFLKASVANMGVTLVLH